ncbi:MAG: AAA family ATPase [Proteobacteria bacterium]|nr:AAA family ATPase [Pseudomonadota bacterium]
MYEAFFGLREPAFALTPDPRFLWLSDTHQEGLAALVYGISRRKGFLLLTGEVGTGKTTLLRAALDQLSPDTDVALVLNTGNLTAIDLLKLIAAEFRIEGNFESKADYVIALNKVLLDRLRAGRNTVLIIDEAQNLSPETLEEVRLLSNLETDTEKLMQIVLVGQPELLHMLAQPSLRQLRQRIAVEHHMESLAPGDVGDYLAHRLHVAGGRYEDIFAPGAESVFYSFSAGCPRLLSLLADRVLLAAYSQEVRPIPVSTVEQKAKSMNASRGASLRDQLSRVEG